MHLKKIASLAAATVLAFSAFAPAANAQTALGSVDLGSLDVIASILDQLGQAPSAPSVPGQTNLTRSAVDVAGQGNREYLIETPATMDPTKSYPVLFGFAGWQHDATMYRGYADLNNVAGQEAIIVYPEGKAQAWEGPKYAETSRGQDVAFVQAILSKVKSQYKVDSSRVYATGLSNGGGMAVSLACQAPGTFAAVASVAGAYYNPTLSNCSAGAVDTLLIHGTADDHMLYGGGSNAHGGDYFSVPQAAQRIGTRNGCTSTALTNPTSNGRTDMYTLGGCPTGGQTRVYAVNGGEHTWFPSNPAAAQVVWDFLKTR